MTAGPYYQEFRETREEFLKSKGAQHLCFNLRYPLQAFKNWQDVPADFLAEEQPLLVDSKVAREIILPALRFWYRVNPYPASVASGEDAEFDSFTDYKMANSEARDFHSLINGDGRFALLWGTILTREDEWDDGATRGPKTGLDDRIQWRQ